MLTRRHLARNPFTCDCHVGWLVDWMRKNPKRESTGVRCEEPTKLHKKKMSTLYPPQLKCKTCKKWENFPDESFKYKWSSRYK
jgi:slit protein 2